MAVTARTRLKARILPRFPAAVYAGDLIDIDRVGSAYTFNFTMSGLATAPAPTTNYQFLAYDTTSGTYKAVFRNDLTAGLTVTSSQISDSTATGRSLITATDAAAARTAIGAGTGSGTTIGPGSSTDNAVVLWNGTAGSTIKNSTLIFTSGVFSPTVNDAAALGSTSLRWSDGFFASGAVLDFAGGATLTDGGSAGGVLWAGTGSSTKISLIQLTQTIAGNAGTSNRGIYALARHTSGSGGFAIGLHGYADNGGSWTTTGNYGVQGVVGEGVGTITGSRVWGGNLVATHSGANAASDVCGLEIDINVSGGTQVSGTRTGLQIIVSSTGTQDAATVDTALRITNKASGKEWTNGIEITNDGGAFPIKTTGRMLYAHGGTITTGIDFSTLTVSGNAIATPGYTVDGSGHVTSTGFADGSSAAAGKVGERIGNSLAVGSATSLTTATAKTICSISLTAGDWDIWASAGCSAGAGCNITRIIGSISLVDNTTDLTIDADGARYADYQIPFATAASQLLAVSPVRKTFNSTTTIYLVINSIFSGGTNAGYGSITARRRR